MGSNPLKPMKLWRQAQCCVGCQFCTPYPYLQTLHNNNHGKTCTHVIAYPHLASQATAHGVGCGWDDGNVNNGRPQLEGNEDLLSNILGTICNYWKWPPPPQHPPSHQMTQHPAQPCKQLLARWVVCASSWQWGQQDGGQQMTNRKWGNKCDEGNNNKMTGWGKMTWQWGGG